MDEEMKIDSTIDKLADQYASCDRRSAEINDERATIRENIEKLGIPSKSFVHAVAMVKQMSKGERRDYQSGVNRVLRVISTRQMELYPEQTRRQEKREQDARDRAAEARTKKGPDADTNPRSDPARGGAGKKAAKPKAAKGKTAKQAAGDAAKAGQTVEEAEQDTGGATISSLMPETEAAKLSQSAVAQQKLEEAMHPERDPHGPLD
jgi:hypothetical protein